MNKRKNVVIVLSDEQSWNTLSVNGNGTLRTPHADALAADGVTLDRCYTAYPLCCPSRSSLWTGLWPHNHDVTGNWRHIRPEERDGALVQPFREAGYHTIYCGKWHVPGTTPSRFGFEDCSAIPAVLNGHDRGRYIEPYREYAAAQGYELVQNHIENLTAADLALLHPEPGIAPCGTAEIKLEHYLETWQTDRFLEALGRRPDDEPFFAVVSYNAPHFPLIVPEPYDRLVDPASVVLPPNFDGGLAGKAPELAGTHYFRQMKDCGEAEWRRFIAHYLGFVALIDDQLGKVVDYLKAQGVYDDTIVVFASDHGDMMGAHRLVEKGLYLHYEETLRVPMIIAGAGGLRGERVASYAMLHDLLPTLADTVGAMLPRPGDARSFAAALDDADAPAARQFAMAETFRLADGMNGTGEYTPLASFRPGQDEIHLSARNEAYRYILRYPGADELYDLRRDPYEMRNVAGEPAHADGLAAMRRLLLEELRGSDPVFAGWVEEGLRGK